MSRTDIHRPSAINPEEYEFVAFDCMKIEGPEDVFAIQQERARIRQHMAQTGGTYSSHDHGGNCHICGAWAIYTALFHHQPSNTYIRTGTDCGAKLDAGLDASAFRASIRTALEHKAGKAKARAVLDDLGLAGAWAVYVGEWNGHHEESVVRDLVGKLVTYGSMSDKQQAFLAKLIGRIEQRPAVEAARQAEHDAASPAPVTKDRVTVRGTVLSIKSVESDFGSVTKCLVRTEAGWKAYGTCPGIGQVNRGDVIEFCARLEVSKDDAKFAFYSRPTKGRVITAAPQEPTPAQAKLDDYENLRLAAQVAGIPADQAASLAFAAVSS